MIAYLQYIAMLRKTGVKERLLLGKLHVPREKHAVPVHAKTQHERIVVVVFGVILNRADDLDKSAAEVQRALGLKLRFGHARFFGYCAELVLSLVR